MFEFLQTQLPSDLTLPYVGSERVLLIHVDDVARALLALVNAPSTRYAIYNAPCECWILNELKEKLESLNPNIRVALGNTYAKGNPRLLDCSRFKNEFAFSAPPIADRLQAATRT